MQLVIVVVQRWDDTRVVGLEGARCRFCGAELNFRDGRPKGVGDG